MASQQPTTMKSLNYYYHKVHRTFGFQKGYNFPLFVITAGAMVGFVIARYPYLYWDVYKRDAIPGEMYYYQSGYRRHSLKVHLSTILPAAFLAVLQFVPAIRQKLMLFHRINGYISIILLTVSMGSAFMLAKTAVGGDTQTQTWIGMTGTMVLTATVLAYVNIKTLQIDQHRAWMLRAWVWAGSIITLRIILLVALKVVDAYYTIYTPMPCAQIHYMYKTIAGIPDAQNPTIFKYPQCQNATRTPGYTPYALVSTRNFGPGPAGPENAAAQVHVTFGVAGWVALAIHVILLELYLALTPAESARLRKISYQRQVAAGFKFADKGSLTASRLGDAPPGWNAPVDKDK